MQKTGCIVYLRPRALTLSTAYFSPEIYGKGSEPAHFAEIAQFRQSEMREVKLQLASSCCCRDSAVDSRL